MNSLCLVSFAARLRMKGSMEKTLTMAKQKGLPGPTLAVVSVTRPMERQINLHDPAAAHQR